MYLVEHKERSRRDSLRRQFLRVWGRNWPCKPAERIWHPVKAMLAARWPAYALSFVVTPSIWWELCRCQRSWQEGPYDLHYLHSHTPTRLILLGSFITGATVWGRYLEYKHTQPVGTRSQNSQWKSEKFSQMIFPTSYEVTGSIHLTEFGWDRTLFWSWGNPATEFLTARAHVCIHLQKHLNIYKCFNYFFSSRMF